MEQSSSWEANCWSANQEIPHLLKVQQSVHKTLPLDPIKSQMNLVHIHTPFL
jgi:hypothetical protein